MTIHATAVAFGGTAVLLRGPSGAGKSDVALRLLSLGDEALHAFGITMPARALIADDRVTLERLDNAILASPPLALRGLLEVRGVGIMTVARWRERVRVALVVDIESDAPRHPDPATADLLGVAVPLLVLRPFDASTPLKIALALLRASGPSERPLPE